jgi:hypothetical protein
VIILAKVIGLLLSIVVLVGLLLILEFPVNLQFSPANNGPYGTSALLKELGNSTKSSMIYIVETPNYDPSYLLNYVESGNTLVLAGNATYVNALLRSMNISIILGNDVYSNSTSYYCVPENVITSHDGMSLVFPDPHPILGGVPLMISGKFSLVSEVNVGKGKLIVFSTPLFFLNRFVNSGYDNMAYIKEIVSNGVLVVNIPQPPLVTLRYQLGLI